LDGLLTNAMLLVLPSDLEGLWLALVDAMESGVCVLASDIPENRELVDVTGFTFRYSDKADLERMLRLLVSEPDVRKAAARKAKERVWSHYQWGKAAREVESQYLALTGGDSVKKPAASVQTPDYRHRAA
jgi:glycosyltransferase involved in cell wall biosynthesis